MTTGQAVALRNRRPRGQHPKPRDPDGRGRPSKTLPEYLEAHQVETLIWAAPNPRARLLFLIEWRAGLRISEALALQARDLSLDGDLGQGDRLIRASRATADHWIKAAAARAMELGVIPPGRRSSNHTLRHSYARYLLAHGRPINFVSRWLGHASIHPPLIYQEPVPDLTGSLASVP